MKKYFWLLAIIFLSWWAIKPLFHSGFFPMHDDTQVVRVNEMALALKAGQFPVRWVGDLGYGYGYPLFNFYAPLAYYFGGLINLVGVDALIATKAMIVLGILLSGIFMYLFAKELWGEMCGLAGAVFYIYAPYHALDLYVRGAIGELWAIAFLPLAFLGIYKIFKNNDKGVIITTVGFAGLVLSHNLTAMMTFPFLIGVIVIGLAFVKDKLRCLKHSFFSLLLGLGLSSFYWLPAVVEMKLTNVYSQIGGGADYHDHFVFLDQLWASPWGFGGSAPGRLDGMSFMIGKMHLLAVLVALLIMLFAWLNKQKMTLFYLLGAFIIFLVSVFFTQNLSLFIWKRFPVMAFFQYPWRFLLLTIFAASLMGGALVTLFKNKTPFLQYFALLSLIIVTIAFNQKYFRPQEYLSKNSSQYLSERNVKWVTSKISDEYLPKGFTPPQVESEVAWSKISLLGNQTKVENFIVKPNIYKLTINGQGSSEMVVNLAYYPGWWKAEINGEEESYLVSGRNLILNLLPGKQNIVFKLVDTPIQKIGNILSLLSIVGLTSVAYVRIPLWKKLSR